MESKIDFSEVSFGVFFEWDFGIDFNGFLEARNRKNSNFVSTGARFLPNRRSGKIIEKTSILESFWEAKNTKNPTKIELKSMCFFDLDFLPFFCDFLRCWLHFGKAWAFQKFKKIGQDDPKVDFGACLGRIFFRRWVWGGFWKGFGRIFGGFFWVADHLLTLILLMWDEL